jgi:hypothetical protein
MIRPMMGPRMHIRGRDPACTQNTDFSQPKWTLKSTTYVNESVTTGA